MKTQIYGASDDLIEIEGNVCEEINKINAKNVSIACSDGTVAAITYDDNGEWKIKVKKQGALFIKLVPSVGDDAEHTDEEAGGFTSYSDVLILDEGIEWVRIGRKTIRR